MRKLALIMTWIAASLACSTVAQSRTSSQTINGTNTLNAFINQAVNSVIPSANVGIVIKSMRNGDTLYSRSPKSLFTPASILKVLTAESALLYLGPNFRFSTKLVSNSVVANGRIKGNLYLVHSGDPSLTYSDIAELMANLKAQGVKDISGNVFIDTSAYDQVTTGPGWLWNDRRYCYAAPISASIINHNCLSFKIAPASKAGKFAQIYTNPKSFYAGIRNGVVTRAHGSRHCYVRLNGVSAGIVSVSGCMAKGQYAAGVSTVISDVYQYDKALVNDLLKRFNIRVSGGVYPGTAPYNAKILATHESKPLTSLLTDMLKMSDNIIAGAVFKKIGQTYSQRPGTWENSGSAVNSILARRAGVDIWHMNVMDGSGLSRYNQITPSQMLQLLDFAFHHNQTNYHLISALPIAGIDGTLKKRMHNIPWRVRAKTGTMAGVVSLAGYAMSADREPLAFVIMVNGSHGSIWKYKEMEDKIMTYLTHYKRG
jgi:D-alanyl-D-alanine carboxypeptidase/D-alanyl-D-alanine-endopeptidase (penicillin-binding protein 4)